MYDEGDMPRENDKLIRDLSLISGRIGILGGTFDPLHKGHLEIARYAMKRESLNLVLFIPNKKNPLKSEFPFSDDSTRLEMLLLGLKDEPCFFASDIELNAENCSYSVDTLKKIKATVSTESMLFFIVGSDILPTLHLWKDFKDIFNLATVVTVARREFPLEKFDTLSPVIPPEYIRMLKEHYIGSEFIDFSASSFRNMPHGTHRYDMLPSAVADYIKERKLY